MHERQLSENCTAAYTAKANFRFGPSVATLRRFVRRDVAFALRSAESPQRTDVFDAKATSEMLEFN